MPKRIAIVGAGALGGHVGGYLTRAGHDVTAIDIWPEHVERMRTDGLVLEGLTEPECFTVRIDAIHLTELQQAAKGDPFDIAFIACKSYDTEWHTRMIAQYLSEDGFCVSLQNSINEPRIASVVGWDRTVGCIAATISVDLWQAGHIRRNVALTGESYAAFRIGECHGRITRRIEEVAEMLRVCDSVRATSNLWGERWSKLCVNAMRNPVAAATGRGGNANDRDPMTRRLAVNLAGEALRVGLAQGYVLESIYGIRPEALIDARDGDADALAECEDILLRNVGMRNDEQRPSMGQDMMKGRRTEIDHISGLVVSRARALGVEVPCNAAIAETVKRIERGEIAAAPEAVAHIEP